MKHHKKISSKPILFLTAALMASQPVSALAVTFSDLANVPWPGAETSIQKAADLGLMVGETLDGKTVFRPRDSVSLCEAAQLAYKLMVNTKKISPDSSVTEKWTTVMQTYRIPDWAYPAMAQCLEKNIIAISDLGSFVQNGTTQPANRESAIEILGRALVAAVPSLSASGSTTFNDNDKISADARPYIALLHQQKIVNGDDAGNFNPQKQLNRSEMAVLVSNLYTVLSNSASTAAVQAPVASSTLEGKISGLTNFYVNFRDDSGYYYFANNTTPTVELNDRSATMAELTELFAEGREMSAKLTMDASNHIIAISVTAEKTSDGLTGTITGLSKSSLTLDGKTYPIKEPKDVRTYLDGALRDYDYLLDIYKDGVTLSASLGLNTEGRVSRIEAKTISSNEKKGEITDLSKDEIELDNDKNKTYDIKDPDDVTVTIDGSGKSFDDLLELYKDDETITATVTADLKGIVSKIVATTAKKSSSNKGVISSLSSSQLKLKGGDSFAIKGKNSIEIKIEDGTKGSDIEDWEDLELAMKEKKEMTVTVKTKNDSVSEITGEVTAVKGTLYSYSSSDLKIETKEDNTYTYVYADKVTVDNDEINAKNLESFLSWMEEYFSRGDNISATLVLSKGKITRIED